MNQPEISIRELNAAACEMLMADGKAHLHYTLQVYQWLSTRFDSKPGNHAMWHIDYCGTSLAQPHITVSGITTGGVLKRFQEELNMFTPVSLADIEAAERKEVVNG